MTTMKPDSSKIAEAWNEPALVQIGKAGLSEAIIAETLRILKRHKYAKVKLLRSTGVDKHSKVALFDELCGKVGATLAGVRGNTAVIYRLRK